MQLLRQQLRIVVGMLFRQPDASVMQKVGQRLVSFDGNLNFVLFRPDNDADQGHEDVEENALFFFVAEREFELPR